MCFEMLKEKAIPIVADRNLYVLKTGHDILIGKNIDETFFMTSVYRFLYRQEWINPEVTLQALKNEEDSDFVKINEGYHSYYELHVTLEKITIGIFMIPKGATFYKNNNGEVVSSSIFFIDEFNLDTVSENTQGQIIVEEEAGNPQERWYSIKNKLFWN